MTVDRYPSSDSRLLWELQQQTPQVVAVADLVGTGLLSQLVVPFVWHVELAARPRVEWVVKVQKVWVHRTVHRHQFVGTNYH